MRRMVVHATTKNYNNLYTSLILNQVCDADTLSKRLLEADDSTSYVPSDADLENGFKFSNADRHAGLETELQVVIVDVNLYITGSPLCRAMSLSPIISFISSNAGIPVQCPL